MKKTLTILLILITAISYTVSAEPISNLNRKKMILAVLDAVDRYESYSGLYSYETKADFVDMFINPEQKSIFCDIYPSASFLDMVSAEDYASLFFNDAKEYIYTSFAIELKNVRVRDIYYRDGRWFAKVSLLKSVSCSDKNYVYFPIGSQNVRSEDFQLEMIMQLDESALTPSFKISQISCTNKAKYAKSNDIYIIHKPKDKIVSKRQSKLRIG